MLTNVHAKIAKAMNATSGGANSRLLERYTVTQYQCTHVNGGAIMGASPETSVVNPWLQHWKAGTRGMREAEVSPPTLICR